VRELSIEGIPAAPSISLSGTLRASPGYRTVDVDVAGPKIVLGPPVAGVLMDLVVRGRLDERGVDISALDGRIDHGPFRAIGRWDFRTEKKEARVHLVGENVLVLSDKLGRVRVSPDIWVSGSAEAGWKVDGSAELPSLVFYGELGDPQASREGQVKAAGAPKLRLAPAPGGGFLIPGGLGGGEKIALDLELRTTREARVENSVLGALVRAELRLGGTLAAPSISGTIGARRGEVKLATGVFLRIERLDVALPKEEGHAGTIYFKGRSGKGEGTITVVIAGPLDDPSLTLSSNPPRKQEDLLATLAFGMAPGAVSGQNALGTLAVKVFEQATDAWPKAEPAESFWSRLSLSTADEDAPDPEKRVPWQLPPTGSARGTIVRTEYLLNSFLSVVVESDREANVSGDLKVRFHFR
jgi:TamB, inner membrane protein subunit of TAM complex